MGHYTSSKQEDNVYPLYQPSVIYNKLVHRIIYSLSYTTWEYLHIELTSDENILIIH